MPLSHCIVSFFLSHILIEGTERNQGEAKEKDKSVYKKYLLHSMAQLDSLLQDVFVGGGGVYVFV